ncbi:MAG: lipopolysaccharide biosynthesis protein [Ruminococcaceae bacterium]|nr:lipopolysaccharide biosynthesis protein [Oscillospiraceae bacterium]
MQQNLSGKIGQATKWSSIAEISAKLISPIVNMVLARLLTPEAFGVIATITMVITFAEVFTDAGFQKYIVQHEFKDEDELNRSTNVAFWTNFVFSVAICIGIFFFRDPIAKLVGSPGLGDSISIASLLIIVAAFSSIQMARYKRAFDFKTLFYARVGTAFIPLLVTVPLAFLMKNYWALLIGNFASQVFNAVILTVKSKWKPQFYYSFKLLKEMFSFTAWTLLESISIWLTSYIGVFIVGSYLDEYYLGLYKTSMSTITAYMGIVTSAINPVLFAALSRYQNDDNAFRKTFMSFQRNASVLVLPMGVGIFLFSDLVTEILLGSQWMEASGFVGIWGLTGAFTIIFANLSSEVFRSKGHPKLSLLLQVLHLAFIVPVLMVAVRYDFRTLYMARSLVRIQFVLTALVIMRVKYKFSISETLKNVLPMVISTVVMGAVGFCLELISDNIVWQLCAVLICIVVYFAVLLGCFPKVRKELMGTSYGKKIAKLLKKRGGNSNADTQC